MLTITTIQTNLHWENKEANLRMLEDKLRNLEQPTEIVLLPEMFSTAFSMRPADLAETMDGETINWMKEMSARHKIVIGGSIIIK
ncbi:MAG: nitrilase family protein, partial [Sphingobacteriales bacterium]